MVMTVEVRRSAGELCRGSEEETADNDDVNDRFGSVFRLVPRER